MVDKITFMETLRSVQEIARTSTEPMSKEEIQTYFKEMDLSEEQQEMIYQYLLHPQEEPTEEESEDLSETEETEQSGSADTKGNSTDAAGNKITQNSVDKAKNAPHFQMYLDEIQQIPELSKEQEILLYERLLAGEETVIADISGQWLRKIIEIAGAYATDKVLLEDLVQEGNIGLLLGAQQLLGAKKDSTDEEFAVELSDGKEPYAAAEHRLEIFVRDAMERYRQEIEGENNSEHTILAKVSLVHEARKALAEETGTTPTLQELSDYTRISIEEITDILALPGEMKS